MTQTATPGTINAAALMRLMEVHPIPGSVYAVTNPTLTTLNNCASDHYGTNADGMMTLLDPFGPRTNDDFCRAWWGKPFAQCYNEILLTERFVQLIRQSSDHEDPSGSGGYYLKYLGGDTLDSCVATQIEPGRRYWVGSDFYVDGIDAVDLSTNLFTTGALPVRNHVLTEFKNAEIDKWGATRSADAVGAGFKAQSGPNLTSAFTPNQTTYPSTLYWPLAISPSSAASRIFYVAAWLTKFPGGGGSSDHELEDSHILHVNGFGTVSETATFDVGAGGKFYICDIVEDSTYDYVFGREYVPPFGNFSPDHFDNVTTDTTYMYVARTPHGSLMSTGHTGGVFDTYQFWGSVNWQSSLPSASRLKDTDGNEIAGDAGVAKLGTNNWILVSQKYLEKEKRCYKATGPEGPWQHYVTVSAPPFGLDFLGAGEHRMGLHTKVHPDLPAPNGYVMTMAAPLVATVPGRHIVAAGTPYFLAVPQPGQNVNPGTINAAVTMLTPTQVQLVIQYVQPPVIAIPALPQEPTHLISIIFTPPAISVSTTMQAPTVILNQATVVLGSINAAASIKSIGVFNVITVTRNVSQGSDDAYELPGAAPNIDNIDLVFNAVGMHIGFRFQNVTVPKDSNVVNAIIDMTISETTKNDAEGSWYGEAIDDSTTFTTTDGNLDGRVKTGSSVSWTTNDLGSAGSRISGPNLEPIVEEIVSRAGWVSGNSMTFIHVHNSTVDKLQVAGWENVTYTEASITINYLSSALVLTPASISASASVKTPLIGAYIGIPVISQSTTMQAPTVNLTVQYLDTSKIDAGVFVWPPVLQMTGTGTTGLKVTFIDTTKAATVRDTSKTATVSDTTKAITFQKSHSVVFHEVDQES